VSVARVLVVDDEPAVRLGVGQFFGAKGFEVSLADSFPACLEAFRAAAPDLVLLDHQLGAVRAVEMLHELKALDPGVAVIVLTGHASIELAVQAIQAGAEQFFTKPVELGALLVAAERALENRRNRRRQAAASVERTRRAVDPFMGGSAAIGRLREQAARVLASERPILISGETGSGKGVLASWLHQAGPRADEPFVDLNCAGLSRDLLESEMFGHERGAFTGAVASKSGLLEVANRGTLFLDEIGDMDLSVQPKLLKAVEEKRFRRLGSARDAQVDVRVIAATHRDLRELVARERFREDLYFRISAFTLRVPPLRERVEDIPLLASGLLASAVPLHGRPVELSAAALAAMQAYPWPGNIREMRNVLERAVLLGEGAVLEARDLSFERQDRGAAVAPGGSQLTLAEVERQHIVRVLAEEGGKVPVAAQRLGIPRSSLYYKLKQYGIKSPKSGTEV